MAATTLEASAMGSNKAKVYITGPMARGTRVGGWLTKCRATVRFSGLTVVTSKVNLRMGSCMVAGYTHGKMAVDMKVNTVLTKSMAEGFIPTLMGANTTVSGSMGFNMELVVLSMRRVLLKGRASGLVASSSSG